MVISSTTADWLSNARPSPGHAFREHLFIDFAQPSRHRFVAELVGKFLATGLSKPFAEPAIACQLQNRIGQFADRSGRKQEASLARKDDFTRAVNVVTDDGLAGDEGLRQDAGQAFAQAGMDDDVHRPDQFGNPLGRDQAGKDEMTGETGPLDLGFQLVA